MSEFKLGSYYGTVPRQFVYTGLRFARWSNKEWKLQWYYKKQLKLELGYYPRLVKADDFLKQKRKERNGEK